MHDEVRAVGMSLDDVSMLHHFQSDASDGHWAAWSSTGKFLVLGGSVSCVLQLQGVKGKT